MRQLAEGLGRLFTTQVPMESDVGVTVSGPDAAGVFSVAITIQGIDSIAAERLSASLRAMAAAHIATALGAPAGSVTTIADPTVTVTVEEAAEEGAEGAEEGEEGAEGEEDDEGVPRIAWAVPRPTSVRAAVAAAITAAQAGAGAGTGASAARPRSLFEDLLNSVAVGALLSLVAAYSMGYYS